jgi:hypothetical protein
VKPERIGRIFKPDEATSFAEQLGTWFGHVKTMRDQAIVKRDQFQQRKKRAGGLLEKELQGLGLTFDPLGNAMPMAM